ncbi:MAG: type II toxin-antitoxin system VapB family antitoxin [Pseudomonadota bacterium]
MRTTLDLPQDLLEEAMNLTDSKTKTSVIVLALEELIRKKKTAGIKRYRGKVMLDLNTDTLRGR